MRFVEKEKIKMVFFFFQIFNYSKGFYAKLINSFKIQFSLKNQSPVTCFLWEIHGHDIKITRK